MMWRITQSTYVRVRVCKMIGKNIRQKSRETEKEIQREREMEIFVKIIKSIKKNSGVENSYLCTFRTFNKKHFDCRY